jgi:hypothetical protein
MEPGDTIYDGDILLIPEPNLKPVEIPPEELPDGEVDQWEKMQSDTLDHPKPL